MLNCLWRNCRQQTFCLHCVCVWWLSKPNATTFWCYLLPVSIMYQRHQLPPLFLRFSTSAMHSPCGTKCISREILARPLPANPCPKTTKLTLQTLLPFASAFVCGSVLSHLMLLKSKQKTLLAVEGDLRRALFQIQPRLSRTVDERQAQPSHQRKNFFLLIL